MNDDFLEKLWAEFCLLETAAEGLMAQLSEFKGNENLVYGFYTQITRTRKMIQTVYETRK